MGNDKKADAGRVPKLLGPQGACVTSHHACRGTTTSKHGGQR